jgi:hypothetical protein
MFKLVLYYDGNAKYSFHNSSLINKMNKIRDRWNIDYKLVETSDLDDIANQRVRSDIRAILPQIRGKIVSSRNYILPLSGKKNLNLKNTPILLLYKEEIPVNVFPHLLGMTYYKIDDFLGTILKYGPADYIYIKGILEDPLQKILSEFPSILEEGITFIDLNVELENGEADLLFKDKNGKYMIVELETFARDVSVTQVCRFASDFPKKFPDGKDPRKAIVCLDFTKNILKACKGAGVELYKVEIKKEC